MVTIMEPYELSIKEASDLMKKKELSPVELVNSCIGRILALDEKLIAWALLDKEGALRMARRCETEFKEGRQRGTLHGIPVGIKDIFYTAGLRTEACSRTLAGFVPSCDAAAVERLKDAGAIILGKTQTTEFAYLDPAPTRNPWNLNHTPGGSSSGSGAAVAARMCPVALGSQTGGSTLRPAAYNGIVGFKAQHGRISTYGVVPLSWTMDHVGILARTVEDAAITFQAIAGYDHRDPRSLNAPVPNPLASLKRDKPPHLGLAREYFCENADEEMKRHTEEVAEKLRKAGAKVTEVVLPPDFRFAADINPIIMGVEAATYHEKVFAGKKDLYRPNIKQLIEEGLATPVTTYARALEERLAQRAKITPLLLQLDGLLTPGAPGAAPEGLESTGNAAMQRPWSTMGIPTIALPTGLNQKGLPLGVQLVGAPFAEDKLIAVASWCEKALNVNLVPPLR
jgi:Asp-tRNA(Asn)/Glu-tRNA(Gln) amidotransferase A subunit family amidase